MSSIRVENLSQNYSGVLALDQISLEIKEGEFYALLGPSGSGKSTLLRLIAGFEPPATGKVWIDEEEVTSLPPEKRNVGMVFQNYALFPHLSVFGNVAYGLRARGVGRAEISERVGEALEMVELAEFDNRQVHSLSGGQQQRVALARAIAPHPRVLLMDEPLSNLDARLRLQTRKQISDLQRRLGMTTVYVTHDQSEALALADRLGVLLGGRLRDEGTPLEVYGNARDLEVAQFLGELNMVPCTLKDRGSGLSARINFLGQEIEVSIPEKRERTVDENSPLVAGIRPEAFGPEGFFTHRGEGEIVDIQFEGEAWRLEVSSSGERLIIKWPGPLLEAPYPEKGTKIDFSFESQHIRLFPISGKR